MAGVLLIISGPSGVGKSTICRELAERPDAFLSVSATTRKRRENEVDGRDYYFVTTEAFERSIAEGRCLEYAKVYGGQYYGTPIEPVLNNLEAGKIVILEIEIEGTLQVKKRFPQAVAIYILAPTAADQQRRLVGRRSEDPEALAERLSKADGEIRYAQESGAYDYFLVNHDVDETVEAIIRIVKEKQKA